MYFQKTEPPYTFVFFITEAESSSEGGEDSSNEEEEMDIMQVSSTEPASEAEPEPQTSTGRGKFYLNIFNLIQIQTILTFLLTN